MKSCNLILLVFTLMFFACEKPEKKTSPPSDPFTYSADIQSSKDISFFTLAITDIDMIMAFPGENIFTGSFYGAMPGSSPQNTLSVIRDNHEKFLVASFSNCTGLDGKTRDGSIFLMYKFNLITHPTADPDAVNYRDFGFSGELILSDYIVNGWKIDLFDQNQPAFIVNKIPSPFDPGKTNMTWEIGGKFLITNVATPSKKIVWEGKLIKTLINTSDPAVYAPNHLSPIKWQAAKVQYTGSASGTNEGAAFKFVIDESTPLLRDFSCAPPVPFQHDAKQFHPFINGIATYTLSNFHPRTINFGPSSSCDNMGTIKFGAETHNVHFD